MKLVSLVVAALLLAQPLSAGVAVPFGTALNQIRTQVLKTKASQEKIRAQSTAGEISRLASDVRRHGWDTQRLERRLADIRRRVNRLRNDPSRPGRNDPFLRNDLRRLTWDLRDLKRAADRTESAVRRVAATAKKDPALVSPARSLSSNANWFDNDARSLEREARWAHWDIRRAGYTFEAMDIDRGTRDIARSARDIESEARRLLDKVR